MSFAFNYLSGFAGGMVSYPTLKRGDKGTYVKIAQRFLISWGYSVGPTGADGDFGANTEQAVLRFNADQLRETNHVINQTTWNMLQSAPPLGTKPALTPQASTPTGVAATMTQGDIPKAVLEGPPGTFSVNVAGKIVQVTKEPSGRITVKEKFDIKAFFDKNKLWIGGAAIATVLAILLAPGGSKSAPAVAGFTGYKRHRRSRR